MYYFVPPMHWWQHGYGHYGYHHPYPAIFGAVPRFPMPSASAFRAEQAERVTSTPYSGGYPQLYGVPIPPGTGLGSFHASALSTRPSTGVAGRHFFHRQVPGASYAASPSFFQNAPVQLRVRGMPVSAPTQQPLPAAGLLGHPSAGTAALPHYDVRNPFAAAQVPTPAYPASGFSNQGGYVGSTPMFASAHGPGSLSQAPLGGAVAARSIFAPGVSIAGCGGRWSYPSPYGY